MDRLLNDAPRFAEGRERLRQIFVSWREAKPALTALIDRAPALREVEPLVSDLADLADVGQDQIGRASCRERV